MTSGSDKQRKVLGKGLSALLPQRQRETEAITSAAVAPAVAVAPMIPSTLPLDQIHPNPLQPRVVFQADRLEELAASIRANGIIQPLIVRSHQGQYQLVAGERRWRAARLAGLTDVPVVVQEIAEPRMLEVALIENIQREDLNPIETAQAYERLRKELGLSQEEIGQRTGKDRSSIANAIRLLNLPPEVQMLLAEHRVSMGHARAILGLHTPEEQIEIAEKTAAQGLSVRQVETLVQERTSDRKSKSKKENIVDPNVKAAVEQLERVLGTRVRIIATSDQRGRMEIEYYSQAELDRLFEQIVGES
jgi:ParB family transcriptional regulator, chromosome partitioning protein